MGSRKIEALKGLVDCCKQNPSLLHTPPLAFFKKFLESLGAQIPTSGSASLPSFSHNGTGATIEELKGFLDYCKQLPAVFQTPGLAFFKDFLQSLGAEIPTSAGISDAEAASAFKDGKVIPIHSLSELIGKLDAASRASRLSIVYFASAFRRPCDFVTPHFSILAMKHPKIVFMRVDFDEARDIVDAWEVRDVPVFYFVKNGMWLEWIVTTVVDCLDFVIAGHTRRP